MKQDYVVIFDAILNDNKLLPLSKFKSTKMYANNLFPQAKNLPDFFQSNLLNSSRVIKQLEGPAGILRIFYYQLLKLGFEIDSPKRDYSVLIKSIIFSESIMRQNNYSPISGKQYSLLQYLRIIAEMAIMLETQVIPNIQLTIMQYPIIDEALINMLELLIEQSDQNKYNKKKQNSKDVYTISQLLNKLCNIFDITLEIYGDCYSFDQSDVFMYAENTDKVYLAYLSEMAEIDETSDKATTKNYIQLSNDFQDQHFPSTEKIRLSAGNSRDAAINAAKITRNSTGNYRDTLPRNVFDTQYDDSYYANNNYDNKYVRGQPQLFQPFYKDKFDIKEADSHITYQKKQEKAVINQNSKTNQTQAITNIFSGRNRQLGINQSQKKIASEKFVPHINKKDITKQPIHTAGLNKKIQIQQSQKPTKLHQQVRKRILQNTHNQEIKQAIINQEYSKNNNDVSLFYNPKKDKLIAQKQQQNSSGENSQTLGTFYREFSNTIIMEAMTQPFRTKVRNTRNHFAGIRSKGFKGLPFLN